MKLLSRLTLAIALALTAAPLTLANAQPATDASLAETSASMSEGEVKKVDKEAGKITIKHGKLKNLDMPPMTMVFRVKDRAMLEQVSAGDKINFVVEKIDGRFTVIRLESKN